MVESASGLSPVAVRRHGNARGLGGSRLPMNSLGSVKGHHVRAEKKLQLKHEHLNVTSSSSAATVVGVTTSNALYESTSKDAVKKLKEKETEFSNRNVVDLTADSPRKDGTELASAVDHACSGLSLLRRHHRISHSHRSPWVSNEGHSQQGPSEDNISVLGSGSREGLDRTRGCSNWQAPLASGERSIKNVSTQKALEMDGDVRLNASSSGAPLEGREYVDRIVPKLNEKSTGALESNNNKGKLSVTPVVDHQASGCSSEPEQRLLWKRKRSAITDAAKSRQRFKLPRMVRPVSASGSSLGGMQMPIDVDNLEDPSSSCVEKEALERARQIEDDEMLAKFLQHEYGSEAVGGNFNMDDAQLAQMLQDEENALRLQHSTGSMSQAVNAATMQAARREVRRVLPTFRSPAARPRASSSRMRILRNLHNRSSEHVMRNRHPRGRMMHAEEHLLHFPEGLALDTRVDFLAALEVASQAGLSMLNQVDRDFNEDDYETLLALDDTNHACSGASNHKIEQLPVSVIKPTDVFEETCSICLETPVVDDMVRRLPCMHVFHLQCIDEWLERQANCPICKMEL